MDKAEVFFTDLRTRAGMSLLKKLELLISRAGIETLDLKDRFWVKVLIEKQEKILKEIYLSKEKNSLISDKILDNIEFIFDNLDPRFSKFDIIKENILVWPSIRAWLQYIQYVKTNAYLNWRDIVILEDLFKDIKNVFEDKIVPKNDNVIELSSKDILKKYVEEIKSKIC